MKSNIALDTLAPAATTAIPRGVSSQSSYTRVFSILIATPLNWIAWAIYMVILLPLVWVLSWVIVPLVWIAQLLLQLAAVPYRLYLNFEVRHHYSLNLILFMNASLKTFRL
jgi:hypothetical protein